MKKATLIKLRGAIQASCHSCRKRKPADELYAHPRQNRRKPQKLTCSDCLVEQT